MHAWGWRLLVCIAVALTTGCQKVAKRNSLAGGAREAYLMEAAPAAMSVQSRGPTASRLLIWRASLSVEVGNISNAAAQASTLVRQAGGFVEREWKSDDTSLSLTLRVPMSVFSNTVAGLTDLGSLQSRTISSEDVTEEFVDTDARLKNMMALRDRLRELLAKATEVKDLLAIETELGRVQGEIESMEARLRTLKGQVDLAEINITFNRKPILGPLGYVFKGLYWAVAKLFVIRP